jgi:hypothetical protein
MSEQERPTEPQQSTPYPPESQGHPELPPSPDGPPAVGEGDPAGVPLADSGGGRSRVGAGRPEGVSIQAGPWLPLRPAAELGQGRGQERQGGLVTLELQGEEGELVGLDHGRTIKRRALESTLLGKARVRRSSQEPWPWQLPQLPQLPPAVRARRDQELSCLRTGFR